METSARNKILLAVVVVIILVSAVVVTVILRGTAGPVNPAMLPGWYLPPGDGEQEDILGYLGKEQYVPAGKHDMQSRAGFPVLSQYFTSEEYMRRNSTDTYRVVSWYFDNRNDFTVAENRLLDHLGTRGKTHPVSLDMTRQAREFQEVLRVNEIVYCPDLPATLQATGFEGTNVSAYFFAVKKPLNQGREDYFLVGYMAETGNLTRHGPYLQDLIARGYYNETGSYNGLEREE